MNVRYDHDFYAYDEQEYASWDKREYPYAIADLIVMGLYLVIYPCGDRVWNIWGTGVNENLSHQNEYTLSIVREMAKHKLNFWAKVNGIIYKNWEHENKQKLEQEQHELEESIANAIHRLCEIRSLLK